MRRSFEQRSDVPIGKYRMAAVSVWLLLACNHSPSSTVRLPRLGSTVFGSTSMRPDAPVRDAAPPRTSSLATSGQVGTSPDAADVQSPSIVFHAEGASASEFQLEGLGFPAISRDGKQVALAFHELQVAGPPVLELHVQVFSVSSGVAVYSTVFREPYPGEVDSAHLEQLKQRVSRWLDVVRQRLAQADLVTMRPVIHDDSFVCRDEPHAIRLPSVSLEVRFNAGRLSVSGDLGKLLFEHRYPNWTVTSGNAHERCTFAPYVTEVAFDAQYRVLVVRADHCSPSDGCTHGVEPKHAVVILP